MQNTKSTLDLERAKNIHVYNLCSPVRPNCSKWAKTVVQLHLQLKPINGKTPDGSENVQIEFGSFPFYAKSPSPDLIVCKSKWLNKSKPVLPGKLTGINCKISDGLKYTSVYKKIHRNKLTQQHGNPTKPEVTASTRVLKAGTNFYWRIDPRGKLKWKILC